MANKNAKPARTAAVSATSAPAEIPFAAVEAGLSDDSVVFRLIHFWHARNPNKGGMLIDLELLLIDEKAGVADGCDRTTGNLLYTVTTEFPANALVHRPTLLKYIVSSKKFIHPPDSHKQNRLIKASEAQGCETIGEDSLKFEKKF